MYQINEKLKKIKRILFATEENLYFLKKSDLGLIIRIPLKSLQKLTLIRSCSAILSLTYNNSTDDAMPPQDFLIETLKRTELIFYIV